MTKETIKTLWVMGIAAALFGFIHLANFHPIAYLFVSLLPAYQIGNDKKQIVIADEVLMDENILIKEENKLKTKENHKLQTRLQELEYDHMKMLQLYSKREKLNNKLALFEQGDLNKLEEKYEDAGFSTNISHAKN